MNVSTGLVFDTISFSFCAHLWQTGLDLCTFYIRLLLFKEGLLLQISPNSLMIEQLD